MRQFTVSKFSTPYNQPKFFRFFLFVLLIWFLHPLGAQNSPTQTNPIPGTSLPTPADTEIVTSTRTTPSATPTDLNATTAIPTATTTTTAATSSTATRPKVALVLAGGGALGFSHIGILELIDELGIPVDMVVGTSMGAIAGGLYSLGYSGADLAELAVTIDWLELLLPYPILTQSRYQAHAESLSYLFQMDFSGEQFAAGLIGGNRILNLFRLLTGDFLHISHFDELPRRFRGVAVDIGSGDQIILDSNSLPLALRASMAVPGFFDPVLVDDKILVDGGIYNNFPVDIALEMGADIIIGVNLHTPLIEQENLFGFTPILIQTINLMIRQQNIHKQNIADIIFSPVLNGFTAASFGSAEDLIQRGREAAQAGREELEELFKDYPFPENPEEIRIQRPSLSILLDGVSIQGARERDERKILGAIPLGTPLHRTAIHQLLDTYTNNAMYSQGNYYLEPREDGRYQLEVDLPTRKIRYGVFELGMGYEFFGGDELRQHFTGSARITVYNPTILDSQFFLDQRLGTLVSTSLGYSHPFGRDYVAQGRFNFLQSSWEDYDSHLHPMFRTMGYSFGVSSDIWNISTLGLDYGLDWVFQGADITRLGNLGVTWVFDSLNTHPFPHSGFHGFMNYRIYSQFLGSQENYQKLSGAIDMYYSIFTHHTFGLSLNLATTFNTIPPHWALPTFGGFSDAPGTYFQEFVTPHLGTIGLEYRMALSHLSDILLKRLFVTLGSFAGFSATGEGSGFLGEVRPVGSVGMGLGLDTTRGVVKAGFYVRETGKPVFTLTYQ